jgi:hypothetical protein
MVTTKKHIRTVLKDFEEKNGRKPQTIEEFRRIAAIAREMEKLDAEWKLQAVPVDDDTLWN